MASELQQPLVTISLVTYHPGRWLEPCLASVFGQGYPHTELIVVDNGGDAETERVVAEATRNGRNVRFIRSGENLGFARAHNLAFREARGTFICALNQDVILDPGYLSSVMGAFDQPTVGSAQGRLRWLGPDLEQTDRIDSTGLTMHRTRRVVSRGQGSRDGPGNDKPDVIFGVDGACPVYRRDALDDVRVPAAGGFEYFDEDFFMYKEDVDLAWRLLLRGWTARYVPTAIAWHARGAGESAARTPWQILQHRRGIPARVKRLSWRNQRLMQVKNEDLAMALRDAPLLVARELAAFAYLVLSGPGNLVAAGQLARLLPAAVRKRRHIQRRRVLNRSQLERWFA